MARRRATGPRTAIAGLIAVALAVVLSLDAWSLASARNRAGDAGDRAAAAALAGWGRTGSDRAATMAAAAAVAGTGAALVSVVPHHGGDTDWFAARVSERADTFVLRYVPGLRDQATQSVTSASNG